MAYTLELENVGLDASKARRRSVVAQFLDDMTGDIAMDPWEANEAYVQKFKNVYRGTVKRDGVLLYSGIINEEDLQYETSERGMTEMLTYAEALKRNPLNPKAELPKVKIDTKVDIILKQDNLQKVIHSFDYLKTPEVIQEHKTNIVKYAQLSKFDSRMQPEAFISLLKETREEKQSDKPEIEKKVGPCDYYRESVLRDFSVATVDSAEWKTLKDQAFAKMKEAHLVESRMATSETKREVEARHNLERKLFLFNVHEDKAGNYSPEGIDLAQLKNKNHPFSGPLNEAFMDYQSAVIGKDWRHTYADGATSLKVESKTIGFKPELEKRQTEKYELSDAGKATIERSQARQEAKELAEKQAEEQRKDQEAKLAEHTAKVERNQPFTEEAMWSELNDNAKLSPSKLRNFLEHTHNEETRTQLLRNNGMTTGQYIESISKEIVHDDKFGLNSEISRACDLAYAYKHKTHKRERDMASLDDVPLIEAKHSFENALFTYQEAKFKGQTGWEDDFKPVLKRYQAYKEIELGRNMEIVDNLITKGQSFHESMEQQFAYEPKKIVTEASRVARPDSKKDEPPMKLVEGESGKSETKAKKSVEGNILTMRQTKAK